MVHLRGALPVLCHTEVTLIHCGKVVPKRSPLPMDPPFTKEIASVMPYTLGRSSCLSPKVFV